MPFTGPILGVVSTHRRVDVTIRDDSFERHVLFLYYGIVTLFAASTSDTRADATLNFVVPDSDFSDFGSKIPPIDSIGLTVTPTNFNTQGGLSVIAVTNPQMSLENPPPGPGNLMASADVVVQKAELFEVQYQFSVDAFLPPRS
jgi:hypothetical protein